MRGADEALRPVVEARPRRRARQPLDERPQEARRPPDALGEQVGRVRVVAAEELVAALAGERDLHVLGRELRDEVGRKRRRVGERLVEGLGEGGEQERRVGLEHELAVLGAVALRDEPRVGRARRSSAPRSRSRTCAAAPTPPRPRARRASRSRRRPRGARRPARRRRGARGPSRAGAPAAPRRAPPPRRPARPTPETGAGPRVADELAPSVLPDEHVPGLELAHVAEDRQRARARS